MDPLIYFYKVTDASIGKVAVFAPWDYFGRQPTVTDTKTTTEVEELGDWPVGANADFCDWFSDIMDEKLEEIVGDALFFCTYSS